MRTPRVAGVNQTAHYSFFPVVVGRCNNVGCGNRDVNIENILLDIIFLICWY